MAATQRLFVNYTTIVIVAGWGALTLLLNNNLLPHFVSANIFTPFFFVYFLILLIIVNVITKRST